MAVTTITAVTVIICAVCIMTKQLGIVDGYDFGAGAYYYADIPGFEKIINDDIFESSIPLWAHIALFLAWGWLMYSVWVWIDNK